MASYNIDVSPGVHNGLSISEDDSPHIKEIPATTATRNKLWMVCAAKCVDGIVTIALVVLVYFLRWTNVFPVRLQPFSCFDLDLSLSDSADTTRLFALSAHVSHVVVISLSLIIPICVITATELLHWLFTPSHANRNATSLHKVPYVVQHVTHICGVFFFGCVVLVIFVDVTKILSGRLRPSFLEVCQPNKTICGMTPAILVDADTACLTSNTDSLRQARLAFPSLHAALTSYSAAFIAIYLNVSGRIQIHFTLVTPLLSLGFILMSLLSGLSRYANNHSYWSDVVAGYVMGVTCSVYHGIVAFRCRDEQQRWDALEKQLQEAISEQKIVHQWMRMHGIYGGLLGPQLHIPRARLKPSVTTSLTSRFVDASPKNPTTIRPE